MQPPEDIYLAQIIEIVSRIPEEKLPNLDTDFLEECISLAARYKSLEEELISSQRALKRIEESKDKFKDSSQFKYVHSFFSGLYSVVDSYVKEIKEKYEDKISDLEELARDSKNIITH